jgi:hypothetical protein
MRSASALAARMVPPASRPTKDWADALAVAAATASATSPNESNRRKITPRGTRRRQRPTTPASKSNEH